MCRQHLRGPIFRLMILIFSGALMPPPPHPRTMGCCFSQSGQEDGLLNYEGGSVNSGSYQNSNSSYGPIDPNITTPRGTNTIPRLWFPGETPRQGGK